MEQPLDPDDCWCDDRRQPTCNQECQRSDERHRYHAALTSIQAYFYGGWPDDDDVAEIANIVAAALGNRASR